MIFSIFIEIAFYAALYATIEFIDNLDSIKNVIRIAKTPDTMWLLLRI